MRVRASRALAGVDHRPGPPASTIHAVGHDGLVAALRAAAAPHVAVRAWTRLPRLRDVRSQDVVLVSLAGLRKPDAWLADLSGRVRVVALLDCHAVDSAWLKLVQQGEVPVVRLDGVGVPTGPALVHALHMHLGRFDAMQLSQTIAGALQLPPWLHWVAAAVCRDPWGMRRPKDLVRVRSSSRSDLTRDCRTCGFARVEHLLTLVRQAMHDALVAGHGLTSRAAWLAAGVHDLANFRRQLSRARRSRPPVRAC